MRGDVTMHRLVRELSLLLYGTHAAKLLELSRLLAADLVETPGRIETL